MTLFSSSCSIPQLAMPAWPLPHQTKVAAYVSALIAYIAAIATLYLLISPSLQLHFYSDVVQIPFWIGLTATITSIGLFVLTRKLANENNRLPILYNETNSHLLTIAAKKRELSQQIEKQKAEYEKELIMRRASYEKEVRERLLAQYQKQKEAIFQAAYFEKREREKTQQRLFESQMKSMLEESKANISKMITEAKAQAEKMKDMSAFESEEIVLYQKNYVFSRQYKNLRSLILNTDREKSRACNMLTACISLWHDQQMASLEERLKPTKSSSSSSATFGGENYTDGFLVYSSKAKDDDSFPILLHEPMLKKRWGKNPFTESNLLPFSRDQFAPFLDWTYTSDRMLSEYSLPTLISFYRIALVLSLDDVKKSILDELKRKLTSLPEIISEAILYYFSTESLTSPIAKGDELTELLFERFIFFSPPKSFFWHSTSYWNILTSNSWSLEKRNRLNAIFDSQKEKNALGYVALGRMTALFRDNCYRNPNEVFELYKTAYEKYPSHAVTSVFYGECFIEGIVTNFDFEKGIDFIIKAADKGNDARAHYLLASYLEIQDLDYFFKNKYTYVKKIEDRINHYNAAIQQHFPAAIFERACNYGGIMDLFNPLPAECSHFYHLNLAACMHFSNHDRMEEALSCSFNVLSDCQDPKDPDHHVFNTIARCFESGLGGLPKNLHLALAFYQQGALDCSDKSVNYDHCISSVREKLESDLA